jgi:hypothetical protein
MSINRRAKQTKFPKIGGGGVTAPTTPYRDTPEHERYIEKNMIVLTTQIITVL